MIRVSHEYDEWHHLLVRAKFLKSNSEKRPSQHQQQATTDLFFVRCSHFCLVSTESAMVLTNTSKRRVDSKSGNNDSDDIAKKPVASETNQSSLSLSLSSPSSNDAGPNSLHEIPWKSKVFHHTSPNKAGSKQAMESNFRRTVHIDKAVAAALDNDKEKLALVQKAIEEFIDEQYDRHDRDEVWQWKPTRLKTKSGRGIYFIVYKNGKIKVAMSLFDCYRRVHQQNGVVYAGLLFDIETLREIIPDSVVDAIEALSLPGIQGDADHRKLIRDLIRLQLAEAVMATFYPTATRTVCERLIQVPSQSVLDALTPPKFCKSAIEFMMGLEDGGVFCLFSWPTLRSRLYEIMEQLNSEFLRRHLPPLPQRTGEFISLNRAKVGFAEKFGGYEDGMKTCPRESDLELVAAALDPLLEGPVIYSPTDPKCAEIRQALGPLQEEKYSHYFRPEREALGNDMKALLRARLEKPPVDGKLIAIERYSFSSIDQTDQEWLEEMIELESAIQCDPEDEWSLCLLRSKEGHKILVMASHFIMFSVTASKTERHSATRSLHNLLCLLYQSGNCSLEYLQTTEGSFARFSWVLKTAQRIPTSTIWTTKMMAQIPRMQLSLLVMMVTNWIMTTMRMVMMTSLPLSLIVATKGGPTVLVTQQRTTTTGRPCDLHYQKGICHRLYAMYWYVPRRSALAALNFRSYAYGLEKTKHTNFCSLTV